MLMHCVAITAIYKKSILVNWLQLKNLRAVIIVVRLARLASFRHFDYPALSYILNNLNSNNYRVFNNKNVLFH